MSKALIFIHEENEGPGLFGEILSARGIDQRIIFTPEEAVEEFDAIEPALLMIMGGPMGVYESDRYPFLKDEIEFVKKRIAADRATLGICLGSQLIAAALGEKVFKGVSGQEIGWNPLKLLNNLHPIRHLSSDKTNMFHWHGDTYELPKGATGLASTDLYQHQAYSYGENILALQCHPEVTRAMAEDWIGVLSENVNGSKIATSREELRTQTTQNIDKMNIQAKLFFEEWLESIGL